MLNINRIVQHFWNELRAENTEQLTPIFDSENPILSTSKMRTWYTKKPCEYNQKSHINHTVIDGTWEATEAFILDKSKHVKSWVKNDHLGFTILYNYRGAIRKYYPDFIIQLTNGKYLVLEVKGQNDDLSKTKRSFLREWIEALNGHGGFGVWHEAVSYSPGDLERILGELINSNS